MIDDSSKQKIKEMFKEIQNEIRLEFCYSDEVHKQAFSTLAHELSELSDKIKFTLNKCDVNAIRIGNVEILGFPDGYEFVTLIEGIVMFGAGVKVPPRLAKQILGLCEAEIKVFVTPTCPYCPPAALTAFEFAFLNKNIKVKLVMANEYPELAAKYEVFAVPKVVINDKISFEGAVPKDVFVEKVMEACTN